MSRNLIYTCLFHNEKYVNFTIDLIRSFVKSNSINCDFLVYTTQTFRERIESELSDISLSSLKFHINNYYNTLNQSRISKVDIFDYKELNNYNKILYIDTDSIITGDVQLIFDTIQEPGTMYTIKEIDTVSSDAEYWGRSLFVRNGKNTDKPGFAASTFGFINQDSGNIKKMFLKIKQQFFLDMYQGKLIFYDQPYLNYYFHESGLCQLNTNAIGQYLNSSARVYSNQYVIHHFSGCPGNYEIKHNVSEQFKRTIPVIATVKNQVAIIAMDCPFEIQSINPSVDYICFTDSQENFNKPWQKKHRDELHRIMENYEVAIIAKHEAYIPKIV